MRRESFPLLRVLPVELREVILDFHWDVELLHGLELPSVELPVAELAWQLRLPFWAYEGRPFQVTPMEVAEQPEVYAEQYGRTMAADLTWPLDVVRREDGRVTILDGVHRLLRAHLDGVGSVRVRVLGWEELDAIAVRR